ncbi:MAG: sel1 repeat family protein [Clostridia bacterium]|nr:sel1 repeat family protein [Clostridia bacterium]
MAKKKTEELKEEVVQTESENNTIVEEKQEDIEISQLVANIEEAIRKRDEFIKSINKRPNVNVSMTTFENYQIAMGHYYKQEYNKAFEYFTKAAGGNHSPSMYKLGMMYCRGEAVERDFSKALEWFKKAIKNDGDVDSVFSIATLYSNGWGVPQDKRKAFDLYMQAAFSDHPEAQAVLGVLYMSGVPGIEASPEKAFQWSKTALNNGHKSGALLVGKLYLTGFGGEKDVEKGISYIKMAADNDDALACYELGNLYRKGEHLPQNYDEAFKYISKSAEQGNESGILLYVQMLLLGQGCEKDIDKGLDMLEKYVKKTKSKDATLALANNYLYIKGVPSNPKRAVQLLKPLLNDEDPSVVFNAQFFLGGMVSKFDIVECGLTYKEIFEYLELCEKNIDAFNKNDKALVYSALYQMYQNGKYLKADDTKAVYYMACAVENEHYDLSITMAESFLYGKMGLDKDAKKGFKCLKEVEKIDMSPRLAELLVVCYRDGLGTTKSIKNAKKYAKVYAELSGKDYETVEKEFFPKDEESAE